MGPVTRNRIIIGVAIVAVLGFGAIMRPILHRGFEKEATRRLGARATPPPASPQPKHLPSPRPRRELAEAEENVIIKQRSAWIQDRMMKVQVDDGALRLMTDQQFAVVIDQVLPELAKQNAMLQKWLRGGNIFGGTNAQRLERLRQERNLTAIIMLISEYAYPIP